MNVQLLSKHFPELNGLSDTERSSILQRAHERAYAPERKLYHWRRNVVSLVCITAVALFIALIAGPALSISRPTTGAIIMVVVLPAFMVIRQRQYIGQLRPEVQAITRDRLEGGSQANLLPKQNRRPKAPVLRFSKRNRIRWHPDLFHRCGYG